MTYAFLVLWMAAAQADGGTAEKPAAAPSAAPVAAARESPPEFSYDLYCDKQGQFSYDGAALALVKRPSHLQRVYADAARGEARPRRLIQELEYWFQQTGLAVADRTAALGCVVLPELQSNCRPPNWGFIDQFLGNSPEGVRLREVLAEAYARRAHQLGVRNDVTIAGVNLLLVGSLAKAAKGPLRFTQTTASPMFSAEGSFAGKSISQVADGLRSGALKAADVPVEFIVRDGNRLIVNTRSSLALRQAGIQEAEWNLINRTGVPEIESNITQRLLRNGLGNEGADVLRITGSGLNASTYTWP